MRLNMQELPISLGRAASVFWSILWRAVVMLFGLGLFWKVTMNRSTHGAETAAWYVVALLVYFLAVWWALRKGSWSEFRVVPVKREQP